MKMRALLIRHAESEHNVGQHRFSGVSDILLTQDGNEQALRVRERINHLGISAVFSSPLKRAIETASLIFPDSVSQLQKVDGLSEIDFGEYEGRSIDGASNDVIVRQ